MRNCKVQDWQFWSRDKTAIPTIRSILQCWYEMVFHKEEHELVCS